MSNEHRRVKAAVSELSILEFENGQLLDDESIKFVAEVRASNLITDDEWNRMKQLLIDALKFLSDQRERAASAGNGLTTFEDPRSADWLRSYTACRLAGFYLPGWASLWLWRLRTDTSPRFWLKIGRIAEQLGCSPFPPAEVNETSGHAGPGFGVAEGNVHEQRKESGLKPQVLTLRPGEPPLGHLAPADQSWLTTAFDRLIRIHESRRADNAHGNSCCVFEAGRAYFQCLGPPFATYLRFEAVSENYVPEIAAILTPEKKDRLVREFGFTVPGHSKNFSRKIEINGKDDLAYIARMAFRILRDIYNVKDFDTAKFMLSIPEPARPISIQIDDQR